VTKRERRLNIVVISAWYPSPDQPMNGVFVRDHARAASRYHDVAVLANGGMRTDARPFRVSPAEDDELATLRLTYAPSRLPFAAGSRYVRAVLAGLRRLERAGNRPDLLHAHIHEVGIAALVAGRRHGIPVVLSEHSSHFSLGSLRRSARLRARLVSRQVDLVCPVSDDLRRRMEAQGIRGRFRVVPNPVDTDLFVPAPPVQDEPITGLFVGGLHPVKRVELLLRAVARLPPGTLRLEIVGDGPARAELEALAADLAITRLVQFRGYLPKHRVAERIRAAGFLVLPSSIETFGVVVAEALAVGRPVLASRTGAIPEIVSDSNGLLVPAGDEEALAAGLGRMVKEHLGFDWQTLSRDAHERFGLDAVGRRWSDVYRSLAA